MTKPYKREPTPFDNLQIGCVCGMEYAQLDAEIDGWLIPGMRSWCVCSPEEKALRAWAYHGRTEAMTAEQRAWCLGQIRQVEGYASADHVGDSDAALAKVVLGAWRDYARDIGVLR
jgi:hypothetical protein